MAPLAGLTRPREVRANAVAGVFCRSTLRPVNDLLRVTTATPDLESAKNLARTALAARLAGNAQIAGPVISVFRHRGEVGEGEEYQVILSTTAEAYLALEAHLIAHHPWDNPEITAVALAAAPDAYDRWLRDSTTSRG